MSKNEQRNRAEINLGNETYDRGLADGLHGRPKSIKKTHRHAHRYHIGYRQGERQRTSGRLSGTTVQGYAGEVSIIHGEGAAMLKPEKKGWLSRLLWWRA